MEFLALTFENEGNIYSIYLTKAKIYFGSDQTH